MEHKLATAERRVLISLVKLVQQRGLEGEKGGWKEFLNFHDKKMGSSLSDPSRRANDVLIAFLMTFKKKEDLQLLARVMQLDSNRDLIEKFKEESPDKETPEQRLVRLTISHPAYAMDYAFESHAEDWLVSDAGKKKSKVMKSTRMVAIDCEMVECDDGNDALVKVAAVDRDLNVILDKFVKPDRPVVNYKTEITGITAEDLEKATLTVADIQKKLRRFLSKGTILVGHSLNNDLKVLKIDHARVIDTSMVFKYSNPANEKRPSLNYLSKLVLGHEVRKADATHNCIHDAVAAMKIALAVVEKGVDTSVPETEEMLEAAKKRVEAYKSQLFLHRIPHYVRSPELQDIFTGDFTVDAKPPKKLGGFFGAVIIFNSPEEANRAFENVDGKLSKDKGGLPQKLLTFKFSSGSEADLYVRKMVEDGEISATTRAPTDENDDSEETRVANVNHSIEEMPAEAETTRLEKEKTKLLLHKIPNNVPSQELQGVITGDFTLDVKPPKRGHYTAVAMFNSPEEANQAFENVDGELAKDRMGLPQKLAAFKLSSGSETTLYVRKMVQDGGNTATKRANTEENNVPSKRQKREEDDSMETEEANVNHVRQESRCEDHLKEIEELKQKLKAKDSVKSSNAHLNEIEELKEKLKAKDSVKSNEDHLKEIEELKQKLKAKELEIQTQDKMIANLKEKLAKKTRTRS